MLKVRVRAGSGRCSAGTEQGEYQRCHLPSWAGGLSPGLSSLPPWARLKGDSPEGAAQKVIGSPLLKSVVPAWPQTVGGLVRDKEAREEKKKSTFPQRGSAHP